MTVFGQGLDSDLVTLELDGSTRGPMSRDEARLLAGRVAAARSAMVTVSTPEGETVWSLDESGHDIIPDQSPGFPAFFGDSPLVAPGTGDAGTDASELAALDEVAESDSPMFGPGAPASGEPGNDAARRPSRRLVLITVPLLLLGGAAAAFTMTGARKDESQAPASPGRLEEVPSGQILPGFGTTPLASLPLPPQAAVTGGPLGATVWTHEKAEHYGWDGARTGSTPVAGKVAFAVTLILDDKPAIIWQTGSRVYAWDGSAKTPASWPVPTGAALSSSGQRLLATKDSRAWVLTAAGFTPVPGPPGKTAMAADKDSLISAGWDGAVTLTPLSGRPAGEKTVALQPPTAGMEQTRWIWAGHSLAVTAWSARPHDTDPQAEHILCVHTLDTGSVSASAVTTRSVTDTLTVVRGQGKSLAVCGPLAVSLANGQPAADTAGVPVTFMHAAGDMAAGESAGEAVLLAAGRLYRTAVRPVGVSEDGQVAAVRTDRKTLGFYRRQATAQS